MLSWQIILYIISSASFYCILSVGFGMILRSVRFFNLAFAGAFLVGGYMMVLFYKTLSIPLLFSLLLALCSAGLYSFLSYYLVYKPLIQTKARNLVILIASFGLLTATSAVFGMIFGNQALFIPRHLSDVTTINVFGGIWNLVEFLSFVVAFILYFFLYFIRKFTRFGRAVRAVEDDYEVAELVGINREKVVSLIFFISGILAALGGMIEGSIGGMVPFAGLKYLMPTIVATVVGGMWSFSGAVLGSLILALATQYTIVIFGGDWVGAVPFVVLIIILLVRPEGILKNGNK